MNATQRKRLLRLADFIVEKVPKENFDMSLFGGGCPLTINPITCGSRGCALGWCTVLFKRAGVTFDHDFGVGSNGEIRRVPEYKSYRGYRIGVKLFGLTLEQSEGLFSGTKADCSAKQIRRDILRLVAKLDKEKKPVFFSVGRGSPELAQKAKCNGWNLFSYSHGSLSGDWFGDSPSKNYYRMKKATKV